MLYRRLLHFALIAGACSRAYPPSSGVGAQRLLLQVYRYALDSLENNRGDSVRACLATWGRHQGLADPPSELLDSLQGGDTLLLTFKQCPMANSLEVHDTVLIIVSLDSIATSRRRVDLRTWRSGLWGAGYSCRVRHTRVGWQLRGCDLAWIS